MCIIAVLLFCLLTESGNSERSIVPFPDHSLLLRQMAMMPMVDKSTEDYKKTKALMKYIQGIARKRMLGVPLSKTEKQVWKSWLPGIQILLNDPSGKYCHRFKTTVPKNRAAACCTVSFHPSKLKFALCFYEEHVASSAVVRQTMEEVTRTAMMETERIYFNGKTTYINLLDVECDPPFDDGLCSQYVSCAGASSHSCSWSSCRRSSSGFNSFLTLSLKHVSVLR